MGFTMLIGEHWKGRLNSLQSGMQNFFQTEVSMSISNKNLQQIYHILMSQPVPLNPVVGESRKFNIVPNSQQI